MKRDYLLAASSIVLIIAAYLPVFVLKTDIVIGLASEDKFYEDATAVFFFMGGALLLISFFLSKGKSENHFGRLNPFILLLGIFLFFCCMEEISWGQRIFHIKTPQYLLKTNDQREINIHNLHLFSSYDKSIHFKTGISKWFTAARLFAIFWFLYCVIIPLSNSFFPSIRNFYSRIRLPIVPIWLGMLFILNYIVSKLVALSVTLNIQYITEIKECVFGFLFFLTGITFFPVNRKIISGLKSQTEYSEKDPGQIS
jgi:hypothetical protein